MFQEYGSKNFAGCLQNRGESVQIDFHYYATYCAAYLAGYSHEESMEICTSAQFVDLCSLTLLKTLEAPLSAATTQLTMEMADARADLLGLQDITRIWASFHFLPYDLYAEKKNCSRIYRNKYRLICRPNGVLVEDTVLLAKGKSLQAVGLAMHVLADTWAHSNFAGTPSLVINNTNDYFYEHLPDGTKRKIDFRHNPTAPDDLEKGQFVNSLFQPEETAIMNLGHGRAGHLPDYSFMKYEYLPAWGDYEEIVKDNPSDYLHAFCQMIEAMKFLRGSRESFAVQRYDWEAIAPYRDEIMEIIQKRQLDASAQWKAFGEKLSGCEIGEYDISRYKQEYSQAEKEAKDDTFLGKFFLASLRQKSMVTGRIFRSGNLLAGFSVDYREKGFRGIRDFKKIVDQMREEK